MTEPTERRFRLPKPRLSWLPWLVAVVLLLVAGGFYARALSTPVQRAGHPTSTVAPLPVPTPAQVTTPTQAPTTSAPTETTPTTPTASATTTAPPTTVAPPTASGTFTNAGVSVAAVGAAGTLHRFSVRVETSLGANADAVARQIAGVLNDPRSWAGSGDVRFALVGDPKKAEFSITVASAVTASKTCQPVAGSCRKGASLVLDASAAMPAAFASADAWQAYLVNHAVGLVLNKPAETCPKKGRPAPVMLDQSGNLGGCTANPWPNS